MANSNLSLETLKSHLFETLEGVKNLNDAQADETEKVSLEQAQSITGIASKIIDVYRLQLTALKTLSTTEGVDSAGEVASGLGFIGKEEVKLLN